MLKNNAKETLKYNSIIKRILKFFFSLSMVFVLTGAQVDLSGSGSEENERRRRGGGCALLVYELFGGDVSRIEQHGAVEWITEPVIQNGMLTASGTIKGDHELFTGEGWVIFNVNEHNKDVRVANILNPGGSYSIRDKGAVDIAATEWQVEPKYFDISAPFASSAPADLDLIVWGKDIETTGIPLAARSIKRLSE